MRIVDEDKLIKAIDSAIATWNNVMRTGKHEEHFGIYVEGVQQGLAFAKNLLVKYTHEGECNPPVKKAPSYAITAKPIERAQCVRGCKCAGV